MKKTKKITAEQADTLLTTLQARFEKNKNRHKGIDWAKVAAKLNANPDKAAAIYEMEQTDGEPDVVGIDKQTGDYLFFDCSPESPKSRRSLCFDDKALESRKENKPNGSAEGMAASMGIELLNEEQYRYLQQLGEFDLKTSSWIATPPEIRKLKGALFCDRRYNTVFLYHNGAESYYASRGFRGFVKV